jgi:hypothetical protein
MLRSIRLSIACLIPLLVACAHSSAEPDIGSGRGGGVPVGTGGATSSTSSGDAASSSTSGSTTTATTGSSGEPPTTCALAGGYEGCCEGNTSYYCSMGSTTVTQKVCGSGEVCGWDSAKSYYACVSPPSMPDPTNTYPIACK